MGCVILKTLRKNKESRNLSKRKHLTVSLVIALLLHFFLVLFVGLREYFFAYPVADIEKEQFFEITELVVPEEESTDTAVENPKKLSDRSYNSRKNKTKFGISGSRAFSFPPDSPEVNNESDGKDKSELSVNGNFVKRLIEGTDKSYLKQIPSESSEQIGNNGEYEGEDNETDVSLEKFRQYSYWIKAKKKIGNAWSPHSGRLSSQRNTDIKASIHIVIAKNGNLELARVVHSSGLPEFDREAIRAIRVAAPYNSFPESWREERVSAMIRFVMLGGLSWEKIFM